MRALILATAALGSKCPNAPYPEVTCESVGLCSANGIVDESSCTSKCMTFKPLPPADVTASWGSVTCSCTMLDEQKQAEGCAFACCGDAPTPAPATLAPTPVPPAPTPPQTPPNCGFTSKDGTVYDFSALKGNPTYGTLAGSSYTFQMCTPTVGVCGTPKATALLTSTTNDAANGCLIVAEWAAGPTVAWNKTESATTPPTVTLNVANGYACAQAGSVDGKFALTVVFTCSPGALLPPGDAFEITRVDQCSARIDFPTSAACAGVTTPSPTVAPPAAGCCGGGRPADCTFSGSVGPHSACASAVSALPPVVGCHLETLTP